MEWSVWVEEGYCAYGTMLSAYIDFTPLPSGAVRCIGPFGRENQSEMSVKRAMQDLTLKLESEHLDTHQFVLWGSYVQDAEFEEHRVNLLSSTCGYSPLPWIRGQILGREALKHSDREWLVSDGMAVHKSGLSFPRPGHSIVDHAMFHPTTAEFAVSQLREFANAHFNIRSSASDIPLFRWRPIGEKIDQTQRSR